ncbi:MAG: putative iron-sulfur-binding oxidoreductase [Osedax symbiont Rs1]|nr:MAG: putative iron-sulfur-binding oxidoreductase [Osedax symbiont Rs1]
MMTKAAASPSSNYLHEINTKTWSNGRHLVRCVKVIEETVDVKTFCFMASQPVMFFFKPGQFVTLELEIESQQIMRSYTISSSPSVPYSFSITVKRAPSGLVSNWLHDNLQEGNELAVHGPVGLFNCIDYPADKVLLLSGGVGITPVMSMARWFFDTNAEVDMHFVHSARTPDDIIYRRELEHMCSRISNFSLSLICERHNTGQAWAGYRGYLDAGKLQMICPDFIQREIFCCGPEVYMRAVRELLKKSGFEMRRYHEESFGATPEAVEQNAIEQAEIAVDHADTLNVDEMFSIEFLKAGKSVQIHPGETVHEASAKLGLTIPKACGMGICGTCKVMKIDGQVEMSHNGGITDDDVAIGYILSCCSVPKSNLQIEA